MKKSALVSKRNEECEELMQCSADVPGIGGYDVGILGNMTDEQAYEQVCGNNAELQSCFVEKKQSCGNPEKVSEVKSKAEILDYMCSEKGRKAVASMENSSCVKDEQELRNAQTSVQECVDIFQSKFDNALFGFMNGKGYVDFCPFVDQLSTCISNELTKQCGHNFGLYFKSVWDIAFKPTAKQLGCNIDMKKIRHLQTRIIPLVVSGAKKRR